jgi:hypothetical protein
MTPRIMTRRQGPDALMGVLVALIAVHSLGVAAVLVFATEWGVRLGGWLELSPAFFARQFGVFHVAIAVAYLVEWFRYRGVTILLVAKTIGALSLLDATWRYDGPWSVPVSAAGDAAMGIVVYVMWRWYLREHRA